jgi:uncharacterized protein (TIGR02594 family)
MEQLVALCRSLGLGSYRVVALALCSAAVIASVTPASASFQSVTPHRFHSARSHQGSLRAWLHRHAGRRLRRHQASRPDRPVARAIGWGAASAALPARGLGEANARLEQNAGSIDASASSVVAEARRYIGGNPTGRRSLWCARFMNLVLQRSGYRGTGSDLARSFASYGQRVSGPQIGAIAVMARRGGGGHVGVVSGIDANGNPIVVSGNYRNRVAESPVPRGRIYDYVMPTN